MIVTRQGSIATADRLQLHPHDAAELAAAGLTLREALATAEIEEAWYGDTMIAAYGLARGDDFGIPWMLSADVIDAAPRMAVSMHAVGVVRRWRARVSAMKNMVHAHNARAVRFVSWLGFEVHKDPVGPRGEFRLFTWERGNV
jgi:hypothetical protein